MGLGALVKVVWGEIGVGDGGVRRLRARMGWGYILWMLSSGNRLWGDGAWLDVFSGFFEVGGMGFGSLLVLWEDSIYLMNFLVVARGGAFLF